MVCKYMHFLLLCRNRDIKVMHMPAKQLCTGLRLIHSAFSLNIPAMGTVKRPQVLLLNDLPAVSEITIHGRNPGRKITYNVREQS